MNLEARAVPSSGQRRVLHYTTPRSQVPATRFYEEIFNT